MGDEPTGVAGDTHASSAPLDVEVVLGVATMLDPELNDHDLQPGSVGLALSKVPNDEHHLPLARAAHLVYWLWILPPIRPESESTAQARRDNTETPGLRLEWVHNLRLEVALSSALLLLTRAGYKSDIQRASLEDMDDLVHTLRGAEAYVHSSNTKFPSDLSALRNFHTPRLETIREIEAKLVGFFPRTQVNLQEDWDFNAGRQWVGDDPTKSIPKKRRSLRVIALTLAIALLVAASGMAGYKLGSSQNSPPAITTAMLPAGAPDTQFAPYFAPYDRNTRSTSDGPSAQPELNVIGDREDWPDERRFIEIANMIDDPTRFTRGEVSARPSSQYTRGMSVRILIHNSGAVAAEGVYLDTMWSPSSTNRSAELGVTISSSNTQTTDISAGVVLRCLSECPTAAYYNAKVTNSAGQELYSISADQIAVDWFQVGSTAPDGRIQPGETIFVTFDIDL